MPRRPDWIEFTLVVGCSLHCDFCPQPLLARRYQADGGEKQMSKETFLAILDHCPLDRIGVDFSGYADACLHPQFIEFIHEARSRCDAVGLYTTFEGLSFEGYQLLKKLPLSILSVHLPDAAELIHFKWTKDWRRIMQALVDDPPVTPQDRMVVKGPLHPMLKFLEPVRVMHIQPRSGNVDKNLSEQFAHDRPIKCNRGANLRQNVALPNGDVYLCCCDYGMAHYLGNLTRQHFYELDIERQKLIERQKAPDAGLLCSTCEFAEPL